MAGRLDKLPESDPPQREMVLGLVYLQAIERAGGLPVVLPPLDLDAVLPLLDRLDGLCLSGGPDLHPRAYGQAPCAELGPTWPDLDAFELAVAREADARGMPVLGICRGAQTMNVARGGTLHQHLPAVTDGSVDHRQTAPGTQCTHPVLWTDGTTLEVNSFHHQAADRIGEGLEVVATAPDGTVEALEDPRGRLFLGVQWHAESLTELEPHLRLFERLVEASAPRERMTA